MDKQALSLISKGAAADLRKWGDDLGKMDPIDHPIIEITIDHLQGRRSLGGHAGNIVYIFEFTRPGDAELALADFADRPRQASVKRKNGASQVVDIRYPPLRGDGSRDCLYVGSCTAGKMKARFKAHMSTSPETGALHLNRWMKECRLPLRLKLIEWPDANPTMIHLLERKIWSARRPLFGNAPNVGISEDCH